jgi:CheY-like chemotaxis protein
MSRNAARILVIEDDSVTRMFMTEILRDAGFEVLDAASGADAIRLLIKPDHLDLVISDVNRPWPDGLVVARHVRAVSPSVPILFVTSAAEKLRLRDVDGPYRTLPTPFTRAGLEAAIDAMMRDIAL